MRPLVIVLWIAATFAPAHAGAQDTSNEARAEFVDAREAYEAGRFEDALRGFERAFELTGESALLYNIATVHDRLRNDHEALDAYERYLATELSEEVQEHIERRIEVLRASIARDEAAPANDAELAVTSVLEEGSDTPLPQADVAEEEPEAESRAAAPVPSEEPSRDGGASAAPWIVVGAGAALVVAGAVMLGVVQSDIDSVREGTSWMEIRDAHARIEPLSGAGWTVAAVGLAAVGAGVVWALADGGSSDSGVALTPLGLSAWGRF